MIFGKFITYIAACMMAGMGVGFLVMSIHMLWELTK